jgi:hypothetical protein
MVSRLALLLVVTAACSKGNSELFCAAMSDGRSSPADTGLNPLLGPARQVCYVDLAACERDNAACRGSGPPRWHCYTWPSASKAVAGSECFPSLATCEATRTSLPADTRAGACTPAAAVYCLTNAGGWIGCTASMAECETYAAMGLATDGKACHRRP